LRKFANAYKKGWNENVRGKKEDKKWKEEERRNECRNVKIC
jgi:hypothetical protein